MQTPGSIIDIVTARAAEDSDGLAYGFLESGERESERLTWGDLDRKSAAIAASIGNHVARGARVLLLFPPGLDFVSAFFGCLRAGAIALPAYPTSGQARRRDGMTDRTVARLRGMIPDSGASLVVSDASLFERREAICDLIPELRHILWITTAAVDLESRPRRNLPRLSGSDVALLQYTSGSTSSPRGVVITHGNLLHNLTCGARLGACDRDSIGVSWLPVNHDMGLIGGVLQPAFSGFPVWLMAPAAFLQRPSRWVQAISRLRATHSAGPNFAYALCARRTTESDRRALDLSTWRVAYNGSEPVRRGTLEDFQRAFGECGFRWEAFTPAYGLAESTLLVCGSHDVDGPRTIEVDRESLGHGHVVSSTVPVSRVALMSSGAAADGMRIAIVDPVRRRRCAPHEIGEIWVAGESVASGYWKRPEETAATFRAFLDDPFEGPFLRTGDLGFLDRGSLVVTGRLKDVLIVRGLKHYPQDLELTAEHANAAVRPGCCAAFSIPIDLDGEEGIALIAEIDGAPSHEQILDDIRKAIADVHDVRLCAAALVAPGTLSRTTSGKLQRFRCRQAFLSGEMEVLAVWTAPPLELKRAS